MIKATVLCISLAIPLLSVSVLAAAQPKQAAPVPAQMLTAKRVFVVNAGTDAGAYPIATFSGEPERAYNSFYAAMKTWGHYQLVGAPSDADLLIEVRLTVRLGEVLNGESMNWGEARFRVVIRDPKTQAMLWAMTEQVQNAGLLRNRDKNFDQALAKLVARLERLTAPPAAGDSNSQ
jgi:hypothetical protein